MNDSWFEIACDVPAGLADSVADFLGELSGNGVCMDNLVVDAFAQSEIPASQRMTIKAYFADETEAQQALDQIKVYLTALAAENPDQPIAEPSLNAVRTEDWSNCWKEHFKPLRVGKRLLIVPTWEDAAEEPGDLVVRIDPGMAFGTGGHETTRLCLELLEEVMPPGVAPSILDLGTGSGILAMAASLLGAGTVLAVDIDPEAVLVAQENLALNGMADRIICNTTPLESIPGTFDVILANILAEELVRLAPQLAERVAADGALILSGILAEKEAFVREGFARYAELAYCSTARAGEWVALLYRRQS